MPDVIMYAEVEGDTKIGGTATVSDERANQLVVEGKATYAQPAAAGGHLPPVGGLRVTGTTLGVEADQSTRDAVLTPRMQRDDELEYQNEAEVKRGGKLEGGDAGVASARPAPTGDGDGEPKGKAGSPKK